MGIDFNTMKYIPLPLSDVRVEDGYCKNAQAREREYLLSLETGRLLAGFYENAGLPTPYVRYGGWESMMIGGHTLGHYLSAISQACAETEGAERDSFLSRVRAVVDGLSECQRHSKGGEGFLWGAVPAASGGAEAQFSNVERGKTNIKREAWVPWYTMHKLLAGLLDAHRYTGYAPALAVARGLGQWCARRALGWDGRTAKRVLSVEYGGMNECLYELYARTGESVFAEAAHRFDEEKLFDVILSERKDGLKDLHANMTIPKILGALRRYLYLHGGEHDETRYLRVAETFFRTVTEHHTYVTGGNSEWEHFGADDVLDGERTNCNCETCNVYNMLKLARGLFSVTGDARYLDYYDNAFVNAILASQNPETGMTTYFQPMASGFFKVYSRPYDRFWCCTGSGMENFTKLGDAVFYQGEELVVARYLACRAHTAFAEAEIRCDLPLCDVVGIAFRGVRAPFDALLRVPDWCAGAPELLRNNEPCGRLEGKFLRVRVEGDCELSLRLPVTVTLAGLPDASDVFAFRYGGAVLSADFGNEDMREGETGVIVTIPKQKKGSERVYFDDVEDVLANPSAYLVREGELFHLRGADRPLTFGLHYKRYRERYAVYLRFSEYVWENGMRVKRTEEAAREPLDVVQPGYGQYETDELHALEEERSHGVTSEGTYRYAAPRGYFGYDLAIDPAKRNTLSITLRRKDNGKWLRITAGGRTIFEERLLYTMGEEKYTREIAIPAEVAAECARKKTVADGEKTVLRIRFQGAEGRASAAVCDFIKIYAD